MPRVSKEKETTFYPPYAEDIRDILLSYEEKDSFTFQDFKSVWKEKTFSLIFEGKPDDVDHSIFVQELYCTCLGYLLYQQSQNLKVSIIYILYLLYNTQPYSPKTKINVSIELYEEIVKTKIFAHENNLLECYYIIQKMNESKSFNFTSFVQTDPLLSSLQPQNSNSNELNVPSELLNVSHLKNCLDFDLLDSIKLEYEKEKQNYKIDESNSIYLINSNLNEEMKTLLKHHQNEKNKRKKIFQNEFLNQSKPKKSTKTTTPRVTKKKKDQPHSLLESIMLISPSVPNETTTSTTNTRASSSSTTKKSKNLENDEDFEQSINQTELSSGLDDSSSQQSVKPRKKRKRKIELIEQDLISSSIDAFLSSISTKPNIGNTKNNSKKKKSKQQAITKSQEKKKEEVVEVPKEEFDSNIVNSMKRTPRKRTRTLKYVESNIEEEEEDDDDYKE
eukprot:gene1144-10658_t